MKKVALLLSLTILTSLFTGCSLNIPSIKEAADVIDAYTYYNKTGDLPPNINEVLENFQIDSDIKADIESILSSDTDKTMRDIIKSASEANVLKLAKQYYEMATLR